MAQLKPFVLFQQDIGEEIMRLDLGASPNILSENASKIFTNIKFTIQATLKNENINEPVKSVLLSGPGAHITGMTQFVHKNLNNSSCKIFHAHKLIHDGKITIEEGSSIPIQFTTSLAAALSSPLTEHFNLGRKFLSKQENKRFSTQIIVTGVLILTIITSFLIFSFLSTRKLKQEIEASKNQIIKRLSREFNLEKKS